MPLRRLRQHRRRDTGRGRGVKPFGYRRGAATRRPRLALADRAARRGVPRRRHQPGRPDEARASTAPRHARRRHPAAAPTGSSETARGRRCASARGCATATWPPTRACAPSIPVLAQAVLAGASGQLRNMATVGGNLLQRTRCLYFQDVTKPCNKRDAGHRAARRRPASTATWPSSAGREHCVATHPVRHGGGAGRARRRGARRTAPDGRADDPAQRTLPAAGRRAPIARPRWSPAS